MSKTDSVIASPAGDLRLERLRRVRERTGLGKSEIYRRCAAGTFPKPLKLSDRATGRASSWVGREIDAWINARIAERDAQAPA